MQKLILQQAWSQTKKSLDISVMMGLVTGDACSSFHHCRWWPDAVAKQHSDAQ